MFKSKIFYHLIALLTIIIWSNTFVSSKILLHNGLSPAEIFAIRFALAYVAIIPFTHSKLWCDNLKDELLMLVLGATGGALYFLAENTALKYTGVSNVCLLVCSAPLLTALLARWFGKSEKMSSRLITGSLIAFAGAALVIVEDWKHMQLKLLGDMLALCGALSWAHVRKVQHGFHNPQGVCIRTAHHCRILCFRPPVVSARQHAAPCCCRKPAVPRDYRLGALFLGLEHRYRPPRCGCHFGIHLPPAAVCCHNGLVRVGRAHNWICRCRGCTYNCGSLLGGTLVAHIIYIMRRP